MSDEFDRTAEQIMLAVLENDIRILAVSSAGAEAGVSTLARGLGAAFARSGRRTLLLDLSRKSTGPGIGPMALTADEPLRAAPTISNETGLATLTVEPHEGTRARLNNLDVLRMALQRDFAEYANIIVDLPPVGADNGNGLNPIAAARAADAVLLVAPTGATTHDDLAATAQKLRQVGAPLVGVVMNDRSCMTLGHAVAAAAIDRLGSIVPRIAAWIAAVASASGFLNRQVQVGR